MLYKHRIFIFIISIAKNTEEYCMHGLAHTLCKDYTATAFFIQAHSLFLSLLFKRLAY
jgi:hypothetical protein